MDSSLKIKPNNFDQFFVKLFELHLAHIYFFNSDCTHFSLKNLWIINCGSKLHESKLCCRADLSY